MFCLAYICRVHVEATPLDEWGIRFSDINAILYVSDVVLTPKLCVDFYFLQIT